MCVCVSSVSSDLLVQLTDTALSRDLFPRDYDCLGDNDNRPVKWLAIEALVDRRFSPASDTVRHTLTYIYGLRLSLLLQYYFFAVNIDVMCFTQTTLNSFSLFTPSTLTFDLQQIT